MAKKDLLKEIRNLMERMEDLPGGYTGLLSEGTMDEKKKGFRYIGQPSEYYDIIKGIPEGKFMTFGYVDAANVEIPKVQRKNPETNHMKNYPDYETMGKNLGIEDKFYGIIKLCVYNFPWESAEKNDRNYKGYKELRNSLFDKYGIQRKKSPYKTDRINFGEKGGIASYAGNNDALLGNTYENFNMYNIEPISTNYYLVLDNGFLKEISEDKLTKLPDNGDSTVDRLLAAGASEEEVAALRTMRYKRFLHSKILFLTATSDGIPTIFLNKKLSNDINGITNVDINSLIELVKKRYPDYFMTGMEALNENEEFIPQGYKVDSNFGGKEIQISNSGDAARIRTNYSGQPDEPSEWMEIQFDDEGIAYVETPNGIEKLSDYMRY